MYSDLENIFPRISIEGYQVTSPETPKYNCIAWAAGKDDKWWWPDTNNQYYWPLETRDSSLEAFKEAFATLGYLSCGLDSNLECGFEKVAIYMSGSFVTHMARQLPSGEWTSKCGGLADITHNTLTGIEYSGYGCVVEILKRVDSHNY